MTEAIGYRINGFFLCPACSGHTELDREPVTLSDLGCYGQSCHFCEDVISEGWGWTGEMMTRPEGRVIVDWTDVLEQTQIVPDNDAGRPWEDCDGYDHEAIKASRLHIDDADIREMRGHVYADRDELVIHPEWEDDEKYLRERGASKQAAKEAAARVSQIRLDQLVEWYRDGWQVYGVWCYIPGDYRTAKRMGVDPVDTEDEESPWYGFDGDVNESLWGIDNEDYAEKEIIPEIAEQAADALENDGNLVFDRPIPDRKSGYLANRRHHMRLNVQMFDWRSEDKEKRPLVKRGYRLIPAKFANFGEWYESSLKRVS